jgi:hypothetical protein
MDKEGVTPPRAGTPQGGCISPLLAKGALQGREEAVQADSPGKERPRLVR